jgi:tRNA (adenine57-N1/adenine58-N1)-methyltransferase
MFECLLRPHDVSTIPKPSDISQAVRRLQEADVKKEERRQRQIANAIQRNNAAKRKREEDAGGAVSGTYPTEDQEGSGEASIKRLKTGSSTKTETAELDSSLSFAPSIPLEPEIPATSVISRVIPEVRGHTSYLTFASKLPHQSTSQS